MSDDSSVYGRKNDDRSNSHRVSSESNSRPFDGSISSKDSHALSKQPYSMSLSSSQRKKHSEDEICLSSNEEPINIEISDGKCESANSFESVSDNDESYYIG